jgi:hypothetical protein
VENRQPEVGNTKRSNEAFGEELRWKEDPPVKPKNDGVDSWDGWYLTV